MHLLHLSVVKCIVLVAQALLNDLAHLSLVLSPHVNCDILNNFFGVTMVSHAFQVRRLANLQLDKLFVSVQIRTISSCFSPFQVLVTDEILLDHFVADCTQTLRRLMVRAILRFIGLFGEALEHFKQSLASVRHHFVLHIFNRNFMLLIILE